MATVRRVGKRWRAEVRRAGRSASKYFDSRRAAKDWAARVELEIIEPQTEGGAQPVRKALERYRREVTPSKKGARWESVRLNLLARYPLADIPLGKLRAADVAHWRDRRLQEVSAASVNRELNLLSSVFERARKEWGWISGNPVHDIQRPPRPRHRERRISAAESERVLITLGYDEDEPVTTRQQEVAMAFLLALETAMRLGELLSLEWRYVFINRRYCHLVDSKNADRRDVPLSTRAVELLRKMPADRERVFAVSRDAASTLFRRAVRNARIEDLRFHDSRHEAITRLAKKLDVLELARVIGHRDPRSLMVYYNATAEEIATRLD